jgi:hypothetical protein
MRAGIITARACVIHADTKVQVDSGCVVVQTQPSVVVVVYGVVFVTQL